MLSRSLLIACVVAAVAILAACRGEASLATDTYVVQEQADASPTYPRLTAGPATPIATMAPQIAASQTAVSGSPASPTEAVLENYAGTPVISPTGSRNNLPSDPPEAITTGTQGSPEDVATIGQMVTAYWEAFNTYNADHAVSMLEASYREREEELIRGDIGRMRLFRVKLDISEESPLTRNHDGDYETHLRIATPVDTRRVLMVFRKIEGQWWIVFSDEVE